MKRETNLHLERVDDELKALIQGSLFMKDFNTFYEFKDGKIIYHDKNDLVR
jgi:hypothetical protein